MPSPETQHDQVTDYHGRPTKACAECGKPLPADKTRRKYCPTCAYDRQLARNRDWKRRNRSANAAHQRAHRRRHPQREACHQRYLKAVQAGYFLPPTRCLGCGTKHGVEAHHPDYRYAYRVVGYCKGCHEAHHKALQDGTIEELPVACIHPRYTALGMANVGLLAIAEDTADATTTASPTGRHLLAMREDLPRLLGPPDLPALPEDQRQATAKG